MKQRFKITDYPYRLDHKNFDQDMDCAIFLTNEVIKVNSLNEEDYEYYMQILNQQIERRNEKEQKREQSYEKTKVKRRRLLEFYQNMK